MNISGNHADNKPRKAPAPKAQTLSAGILRNFFEKEVYAMFNNNNQNQQNQNRQNQQNQNQQNRQNQNQNQQNQQNQNRQNQQNQNRQQNNRSF